MIATIDSTLIEEQMVHLFEARRAALTTGNDHVDRLRERAMQAFDRLGIPSRKDEAWKYTDPSKIFRDTYAPAPDTEYGLDLSSFLIPGLDAHTLVFVNGRYRPDLSDDGALDEGVVAAPLSHALAAHPDLIERHYGAYADPDTEAFVALNTALSENGLFVYAAPDVKVEKPIVVLYISDAQRASMMFPRTLVVASRNSELTVVEGFFSTGGRHLNVPVTELYAGGRAHLTHYRLQDEGAEATQVGMLRAYQEESTVLRSITATFSGRTVRNNVHFHPDGEHCETHLGGLFVLDGDQHVDNHTFVDHARPHCFSNELFKGILDDRASSAFSGMLLVRRQAQKTNAFQENKTILLTDDAASYAKPQLEIYADDVRCSHGATTGEVDPEALFYLRARCIGEEQARNMLLFAFVSDVADMIHLESLRDWVVSRLHQRLD